MLPMMILMVVLMYFVAIRPQQKRQKELAARIAAMKIGDRVITSGGMYGLVANLKERTVLLKVADNVKIEFDKASIASILSKEADESKEATLPEATAAK